MIVKYSDQDDREQEVKIVSGPLSGKIGHIKEASQGRLKVCLKDGKIVEVDEAAAQLVGGKA